MQCHHLDITRLINTVAAAYKMVTEADSIFICWPAFQDGRCHLLNDGRFSLQRDQKRGITQIITVGDSVCGLPLLFLGLPSAVSSIGTSAPPPMVW